MPADMESSCPSEISDLRGSSTREIFGWQILRRLNTFSIQSVRNQLGLLLEHDADGHAGERFSARSQFRQRFAIAATEIAFVNELSVTHDQKSAVLAGLLNVVEGLIQLGGVDARCLPNLGGVGQRSPSALRIRRRKVISTISKG